MTGGRFADGHGERKCGADKRQGEGTCRRPAGWGTDPHPGTGRCKLHGGATPTQSIGAERRQVDDGARRVLAGLGVHEPVADPLTALQGLAGEVVALKDALRGMVERLTSVRYGGMGGEQVRGEVALYERALDRAGRLLTDMARLNIDQRVVEINARISQSQGEFVAAVLRAALSAAGVAPGSEQEQAAHAAFARELRAGAQRDAEPARIVRGELSTRPESE